MADFCLSIAESAYRASENEKSAGCGYVYSRRKGSPPQCFLQYHPIPVNRTGNEISFVAKPEVRQFCGA